MADEMMSSRLGLPQDLETVRVWAPDHRLKLPNTSGEKPQLVDTAASIHSLPQGQRTRKSELLLEESTGRIIGASPMGLACEQFQQTHGGLTKAYEKAEHPKWVRCRFEQAHDRIYAPDDVRDWLGVTSDDMYYLWLRAYDYGDPNDELIQYWIEHIKDHKR